MDDELPILKGILKGIVSYHNARKNSQWDLHLLPHRDMTLIIHGGGHNLDTLWACNFSFVVVHDVHHPLMGGWVSLLHPLNYFDLIKGQSKFPPNTHTNRKKKMIKQRTQPPILASPSNHHIATVALNLNQILISRTLLYKVNRILYISLFTHKRVGERIDMCVCVLIAKDVLEGYFCIICPWLLLLFCLP